MRRLLVVVALVGVASGCGDELPPVSPTLAVTTTSPVTTSPVTTSPVTTSPVTTSPVITSPVTAGPVTTSALTVGGPSTPAGPPPTTVPLGTPYVIPVADVSAAGWGDTHAAYPATDIFVGGCGGVVVSPVNGELLEVRRINGWDPDVDNPATRGGRSVSILGDDGVRYYLAHLEIVEDVLEPGGRIAAGDRLGTIGTTGRSSACHVHFGISPPCPEREWSVRRGVVWPFTYLEDWRDGGQASPAAEVAAFVEARPDACAEAAADPNATDA